MKMTKLYLVAAALISAVWLAGCATTPESRISHNPEIFAQLTPQEQALVKSGQVGIGFSAAAVKLALGDADRISVRTDAQGQAQVWHYTETVYYDGAYIYGGPYWGGWGHRRWGWGGGWWWGPGAYPSGPVSTYDRFQVEFRNGKVVSVSQEYPSG